MHNRPINNETDLIRNIFSRSLNENKMILEAGGPKEKGKEKGKGRGRERLTPSDIDRMKAEREAEKAEETPAETPAEAPTIEVGGVAEPTKTDWWSSITDTPDAANIPGVKRGKTTKADLPQASDKRKYGDRDWEYPIEPERTGNMSNILKALAASSAGVMGIGTALGAIIGAAGLADKNATVSGAQKAFVPEQPAKRPETRPSPSTPTSADTGKIASLSIPTLPTASVPPSQSLLDLAFKGRVGTPKTSKNTVLAAKPESPSKSKDVIGTIQAITTKASTLPFEAPPEPDQKVYTYPGTFVGSEATPQLQSKVDSNAPLEPPPEPGPISPRRLSPRRPQRPAAAPQPIMSAPPVLPAPSAPSTTAVQSKPKTLPVITAGRGERADKLMSAGMPRDVETRPATDESEAIFRIVPGSQSWSELSPETQQKIIERYRSGASGLSIRFKDGKFEEPGYGDQGQYGDIVRALNTTPKPESVPQRIDGKAQQDINQTISGIVSGQTSNEPLKATSPTPAPKRSTTTRPPSATAAVKAAGGGVGAAGAAGAASGAASGAAAGAAPPSTPNRTFGAKSLMYDKQGRQIERSVYKVTDETGKTRFESEDRVLEPYEQSEALAAAERDRKQVEYQQSLTGPLSVAGRAPVYESIRKEYYNILSQRLDEAKTEPSGAQVNQAAYGFDPRGGRNARKALASLKSGMWRGDSTSSGKIRSETKPSPIDSQFQPSWGERLKPHVITLMSAAQDHKIELSKEEAVNPSSRDHQRLLSMYPKDHDVHKASQAVGEIMRARSNA